MHGGLLILLIIIIWSLGRQSEPSTTKLQLMENTRLPKDIAVAVRKKWHAIKKVKRPLMDKVLICSNCKREFIFTAFAQKFFLEKGLTAEPKLCGRCHRRFRKGGDESLVGVPC